jgi:hypothetical protein
VTLRGARHGVIARLTTSGVIRDMLPILRETCYEDLGVHGRSFFAFDHIADTALRIARAVWEDSPASSCRW